MTDPVYISTLGSDIKNQQANRDMFEALTQEFLNQGGKITQLGDVVTTDTQAPVLSAYNQKMAAQNRKKRDSLVEDVIKLLEEGMAPSAIQKRLGLHYKSYVKLIKENGLEGFAE